MNRYRELKQEQADLIRESDTLTARSMTDSDRERDDAINARLETIAGDLARIERQRERERTVTAVADINDGMNPPDASRGNNSARSGPPTPFRSLGHQLQAVVRAAKSGGRDVDPGLTEIERYHAAALGANETVGSDGGFLVQQDIENGLLGMLHETGVLISRTTRRPVGPGANGVRFNMIDESSRANGSRWGGVQAYWLAEAGTPTATKPKFRQVNMSLEKLMGLYYATDEELADATQLAAVASQAFAEEFGFKVDDALIRGGGAGVPLGILNSGGTVSISKETGQAAGSIVAENIEKMFAALPARSLGKAEWYINQECWPQLFQLSHAVGTGGVPMFVPAGGLNASPFGTLLGRNIMPIEHCEAVGTVGDIIFGDFSQYIVIEKGGVDAASSIHVQFLTDETTFRFILRLNGQPRHLLPLTPYKGSQTQSPFVTLATRA